MRFILILIFLGLTSFAQEVQVSADNFSANELKGVGKFTGNVIITKGKDILKSNELIINFDKKKKPLKYEALGNASITVFMDGKHYYGKGNSLIYNPVENLYTIEGDAFLEEKTTGKKVYGKKIVVNQKNGKYEVSSDKNKPVKFIFQIDDSSIKKIKK